MSAHISGACACRLPWVISRLKTLKPCMDHRPAFLRGNICSCPAAKITHHGNLVLFLDPECNAGTRKLKRVCSHQRLRNHKDHRHIHGLRRGLAPTIATRTIPTCPSSHSVSNGFCNSCMTPVRRMADTDRQLLTAGNPATMGQFSYHPANMADRLMRYAVAAMTFKIRTGGKEPHLDSEFRGGRGQT